MQKTTVYTHKVQTVTSLAQRLDSTLKKLVIQNFAGNIQVKTSTSGFCVFLLASF